MLRFAMTPGLLREDEGLAAEGLIGRCRELAEDGVEYLLLREKLLDSKGLVRLGKRLVERVSGCGMKVVVPGCLEAGECGSSGAHARLGDLPCAGWVSVSCHTVDEVRVAQAAGVGAVLFAPVYGKWVNGAEVVRGVGLEMLREACVAAEGVPVFALGGVSERNAAECVGAGAAGIAGIRMFFGG